MSEIFIKNFFQRQKFWSKFLTFWSRSRLNIIVFCSTTGGYKDFCASKTFFQGSKWSQNVFHWSIFESMNEKWFLTLKKILIVISKLLSKPPKIVIMSWFWLNVVTLGQSTATRTHFWLFYLCLSCSSASDWPRTKIVWHEIP